jgi:hypothetical protein
MNANKQGLNEAFKRFQRLPDWPLTSGDKSTRLIEESKGTVGPAANPEGPGQGAIVTDCLTGLAE